MAITTGIIGAAVAIGTSTYGVVKNNEAVNAANEEADRQAAQEKKLEADANAKVESDQRQKEASATQQYNAQRARTAAGTRRDTLLTGPLGLTDKPSNGAGRKTLLGV